MVTFAGVDVAANATGGAGTSGSPWTGWDSATTWSAETTYYFRSGYYNFSSTLTGWAKQHIRIVGEGMGTVLQFTGTGVAIDVASVANPGPLAPRFEHFKIVGNPNCTKLFRSQNMEHVRMLDVYARECTTTAFEFVNTILGHLDAVRFSVNEEYNTTKPTNGFTLNGVGALTITNMVSEGAGVGLNMIATFLTSVFGGTIEACTDIGIAMDLNTTNNTFVCVDLESNTNRDVKCYGWRNNFIGLNANGNTEFPSGGNANQNHVYGGIYTDVAIGSGALGNVFRDVYYNTSYADSGTGTITDNVVDGSHGTVQPSSMLQRAKVVQQKHGATQFIPTVSASTGLGTGNVTVGSTSSDSLVLLTLNPSGSPSSSGSVTVDFFVQSMTSLTFPNAVPFPVLIYGSGSWATDATVQAEQVSSTQIRIRWRNGATNLSASSTYKIGVWVVSQ